VYAHGERQWYFERDGWSKLNSDVRPSRWNDAHWTVQVAVVSLVGLAIGALTSFLQTHLSSPWNSIVNSVTPWLLAAFVVGAISNRLSRAVEYGFLVTFLELVGYTVTASLRGYPSGLAITLFWALSAVVGGPVFGWAGMLWARGSASRNALGAAILAGAFLAEGTEVYAIRFGDAQSAILFWSLGVATVLILGRAKGNLKSATVWLAVTLPVGMLAEVVLGLVYNQRY
jgi:hypothetical protein